MMTMIEKNPLDDFHIGSRYYEIEQINTTVLPNAQNFKYCIMHYNIRSLSIKFTELKEVISRFHDIKMYIHCIMSCESFLPDNHYVFDKIPGYKLVCRNRQTGSRVSVVMYIGMT